MADRPEVRFLDCSDAVTVLGDESGFPYLFLANLKAGVDPGHVLEDRITVRLWCFEQFGERYSAVNPGGRWLVYNEGGPHEAGGIAIHLASEADATAFKLRWC